MYATSHDQQLSDDQFLQWGQSAQGQNPYQDASGYGMNTNGYAANSNIASSTQIARRPMNSVVSRPQVDSAVQPWADGTAGPPSAGDGAWADGIEELEQKAQVAKRDAQAKRKQIPPFVQKLNRYDKGTLREILLKFE